MTRTTYLLDWPTRYAMRIAGMKASEIRELLKLLENPGVISFAGGIPDPMLFPTTDIATSYSAICSDPVRINAALQYSVSEGDQALRKWVTEFMETQGVACESENILITNGSQQGLEFLGRLLLNPNDTALVEAPTYLGALQAFSAMEPVYDTLHFKPSNRSATTYCQAAAQAGGQVKFTYVVPDFANPTGRTLSLEERQDLLKLAQDLDVPVIEDSPYRMLRYDGVAIPMIQALDVAQVGSIESSRVISAGSFSKIFTPGLRVGWLCGPSAVIEKLTLIKQASDLCSSAMNQAIMGHLAETQFDRQVKKVIDHYRVKRNTMLTALERHMPDGVRWSVPEGGLFIWVTLPDHMDAAEILPLVIEQSKIAYVPGQAFFADGSGRNTLRLNFSLPSGAYIEKGITDFAEHLSKTV